MIVLAVEMTVMIILLVTIDNSSCEFALCFVLFFVFVFLFFFCVFFIDFGNRFSLINMLSSKIKKNIFVKTKKESVIPKNICVLNFILKAI